MPQLLIQQCKKNNCFQVLAIVAHPLPCIRTMKAQTNNTILKHLAEEVVRNPLWGMLKAAEYFEKDSPFYKALKTKAHSALANAEYRTNHSISLDDLSDKRNGSEIALSPPVRRALQIKENRKRRSTFHFSPRGRILRGGSAQEHRSAGP